MNKSTTTFSIRTSHLVNKKIIKLKTEMLRGGENAHIAAARFGSCRAQGSYSAGGLLARCDPASPAGVAISAPRSSSSSHSGYIDWPQGTGGSSFWRCVYCPVLMGESCVKCALNSLSVLVCFS